MADLGSRAANIVDKLAAGLRVGNVHAVKDATQELRRRGFDPDIHLRAILPLLERTLLTLIARGQQHHEQTDFPDHSFRTVLHILDTLNPADWPELAQLLDDYKQDIIRDLLLRMREGWTASALVAVHDLQHWGLRWPELAIIERTAQDDVDSGVDDGVDESRDDYTPGTESLLRYLRQDLDRGDYDAALEIIGEFAWAGESMDLSELLNSHKPGLMRAMLTTMSNNNSEGVLYIMPSYLSGLEQLGMHWPEFDTIQHSLETMAREQKHNEVTEGSKDGRNRSADVDAIKRRLRSGKDTDVYMALSQMATMSRNDRKATRPKPNLIADLDHRKTDIIKQLLTVFTRDIGLVPELDRILETLNWFGVQWPELETIKTGLKNIRSERQQRQDLHAQGEELDEDYAFGKPAPSEINALFDYLESHEGYYAVLSLYRLADADLDPSYAEDILPYKTLIIRGMLEWAKEDPEWSPIVLGAIDTLRKVGIDWPELDSISKSALSDYNQLTETNPVYVKQDAERAVRGVSSKLEKMRKAGLSWEAYYQLIDALYGVLAANRSYADMTTPVLEHYKTDILRTLLWSIKASLEQGRHDMFMESMFDAFARARINWPEIDAIKRSMRARLGEAWSKKYKKSINCAHPRGFSQKAHCAARRKRRAGGKTKSKSVSEAIRGQQRFIQSTADRLRDDLEQGDWISANYTVQRLNQTDPKEVQEIFEPLAPLFAKMVDDDPMGTLNYMDRITGYIDHVYPEITRAYDRHKTEIMQQLLKEVRSGNHEDWVRRQIGQLRNCGIDWSELNVITRSLLESDDSAAAALRDEARDTVIGMFTRDLRKGGRGIYYVMYHMDDWGLQLKDWPEVAEMIDDHKRAIVKELLKTVNGDFNDDQRVNRESARFTIDRMKRIGVEWPELDVIQKSIDADQLQLIEDFSTFEETMELIASHMSDIANHLEEGHDLWLVGDLSDIYITLENENLDQQYWPKPEDWDIDLQANKTNFVKGILEAIKLGEGDEAVQAVHMLKDYWHVSWPEFDIILKSANANRAQEIDELRGYRSDPVYAASQKELAPSKMKTASERETAMEKFTDYMETQGFKHIGHGSFSSVYLKDGYPWMFKLWSHDPAYLWWITWAAKHQDNPNVPRVKGLPVKIAPDTYVVRLEKLRGLVRRPGNLSKGYEKLAYLVDRIESVDDLSKEDLQWIRSEYPGVYDILRVIQRAGSSFVVDLHDDNIMLRGQVPVITDPVVG